MKKATKEEKVAKTMIGLVNDLDLDIEAVGRYVGEQSNTVLYNRLNVVIDAAQYRKEQINEVLQRHGFQR